MLGIIAGTGFKAMEKAKTINTKYGNADVSFAENFVFIQRHGKNKNIPPHKINYKANLFALKELEVEQIIAINSVGSLKKKISPQSILIPDDFICLWQIPTFYDNETNHVIPEISENLRNKIIKTAKKVNIKVIEKGIYAQAIGPRLETKAEISLLKNFADVVGMTMASECTLANELEIEFASICTVDNYANGITDETLDFDEIRENAMKNSEKVGRMLVEIVKN